MYNRVVLAGRLTKKPESRTLQGGTNVTRFALAINRRWTKPDGQKGEETTFVDCEAWGKTGETIAVYCDRGSPLLVEGRLRQSSWTDAEGHKHAKLGVVVERFTFLPAARQASNETTETHPEQTEGQPDESALPAQDIPF